MKNEQNVRKEYEPPEIRLLLRHFQDFLEVSGNRSETFGNDPFDSDFGISF